MVIGKLRCACLCALQRLYVGRRIPSACRGQRFARGMAAQTHLPAAVAAGDNDIPHQVPSSYGRQPQMLRHPRAVGALACARAEGHGETPCHAMKKLCLDDEASSA